jgi:hypothetical protein
MIDLRCTENQAERHTNCTCGAVPKFGTGKIGHSRRWGARSVHAMGTWRHDKIDVAATALAARRMGLV